MTTQQKIPKYSVDMILQLNSDSAVKQKITSICYEFYDETGISDEVYYYVKLINNDAYPPSPIKESAIDKYYSKQ